MGTGPIYGVTLPETLPIGRGSMKQAMPSRRDLEETREVSERTAAAYEVLVSHWRNALDDAFKSRRYLAKAICNAEDIAAGRAEELREEIEEWLDG